MVVIVMTLQQIKYFICTAETGSISEAAKRMYVAQSSVSAAIKEMESYCGVQLFQRSAKGVILTGAGEELLLELRVIDKKMDFLKDKYNERNKKSVTFSVAAQHHICGLDGFLSVAKWMTAEEYKICFLECCTSEILENVARGYADIGVFFYSDPMSKQVLQEMKNHNLQHHSLGKEKIHAHMHKNHPLTRKKHIYLNDLMDYPCVTYDRILRSNPLSGEVIAFCPRKIGTTDRAAAYSMLCSLDAFVTGTSYLQSDPHYHNILSRPIEDGSMIHLVWVARENYNPSDMAQRFINTLPHL